MIHERLDIAYWKSFFSLRHLRQAAEGETPEACIISGPYDIAVLEQLREASYAHLPGIERVPTDIFVWSRGESDQRAVTKIGGLPYRVTERPWPVAPSGAAMTFAAQICFADSRDIVPVLPGDVLLIFTEAKNWGDEENPLYDFMGEGEDDSSLLFEWVPLTTLPLVTRQDIPETGLQIMPCYGSIHRTWDYPHVDGFAYPEIAQHIPPVFVATKIGGVCPYQDMEYHSTEGYFCSLSSLDNEIYQPFPFLNVPEPISGDEWKHSHPLTIGDVGLINLFLNRDGSIRWTFHG
jgi:uncharacterized protein DUF1963